MALLLFDLVVDINIDSITFNLLIAKCWAIIGYI